MGTWGWWGGLRPILSETVGGLRPLIFLPEMGNGIWIALLGDLGTGNRNGPDVADIVRNEHEPGGNPQLGVKLWIEHKKRKWSTNSARSLKALAS
jgi:hypothetical protein